MHRSKATFREFLVAAVGEIIPLSFFFLGLTNLHQHSSEYLGDLRRAHCRLAVPYVSEADGSGFVG